MKFNEWLQKYNIRTFHPTDEKGKIDSGIIVYQGTIGFSLARPTILKRIEKYSTLLDELFTSIEDSQSLLEQMKKELVGIKDENKQ